ncbi:MAG: hypothetical protein ACXVA9_02625 [Bdellovibrionales bacterium]
MHKLFIRVVAAGLVLTTGLVSCSKENKTTDVYRTKPPVIRSGQGSQDLKTWNSLKNKEFDLQDVLDFSESAPSRIEMKSHCQTGTENYYGQGSFSGNPKVQIWQVLPYQVLTEFFDKKTFTCGLELSIYNDVGSNHVFTIAPVPIVEKAASSAKIEMEGNTPMPARLIPNSMQDIRIRFRNSATAAAKLICQDIELNPLPFESVVDLSHFNFAAPSFRPDRDRQYLSDHTLQNCRAIILENGNPSGLSNLVQIGFLRKPMIIQIAPAVSRVPISSNDAKIWIRSVMNRGNIVLENWTLTNTENIRRYFLIPQNIYPFNLHAYYVYSGDRVRKLDFRVTGYRLDMEAEAGRITADDQATWKVSVGPGESFGIQSMFRGTDPIAFGCSQPLTLAFDAFDPAVIAEVDANGIVLSTFSLQPRDYQIGPDMDPRYYSFIEGNPCTVR